MNPGALDELARKVNGRINPARDACAFPCRACGENALARWPDGQLTIQYFCGCPPDDNITAAFSAAFNPPASPAIANENDNFDSPAVESSHNRASPRSLPKAAIAPPAAAPSSARRAHCRSSGDSARR